ncbi:MAG: transcription antitermination factor NusB [Endomicrobium sp.]|jgi:N utilization substance protein B|nr:transcription antitermination factor NusB [Endomicrobium sp.]
MSSRRQARECSLQMLYEVDNCNIPVDVVYASFNDSLPKAEVYKQFATSLLRGVCDNKEVIDSIIKQYAKNWDLERMAVIDRNIMRIAIYEIMATPNTPVNVIIDEAVEISKKYSTEDSSKFINGILDNLKGIRTPKNSK